MKSFLLAALLAGASLAAQAQTYYLDLTGQPLNVPNRNVAVEVVMDGRVGHQAIGVVYRGLGNKPAAVLFRKGLEPELMALVQAQLPARPTDPDPGRCAALQLRQAGLARRVQLRRPARLDQVDLRRGRLRLG